MTPNQFIQNISSLSVIVNARTCELRDDVLVNIENLEQWLNSIINHPQQDAKLKKSRCEICNSKEDSNDLELHHVAGRKHDYRMITVCKECHIELTKNQSIWDKRWLITNQPEMTRMAFFLYGLKDILALKSKKTGNSIYDQLARYLTIEISKLLA
jgi:hypothetical protein